MRIRSRLKSCTCSMSSMIRLLVPTASCWTGALRHVSTSTVVTAGQAWREKHGLPRVGNEYGPLTDNPDWSYADGRPAPMTRGKRNQLLKQMEYAKTIIKLVKEVDFAVEREKTNKKLEERKRAILDGKLKPKGRQPLD